MNYKYVWPHITNDTKKAVNAELDKGEISIYDRSGIFERFEDEFAKVYDVKHALLFSSGTASIHASMVGCGFGPGDEVICPAYTFFATVTPLFQTGAVPVLCDAQEDGNIDPNKIESLITSKTKGLIITHMWGVPCEMDKIMNICKKYNLKLIEDCSHAHGAMYKGKRVGTFGTVGAFSLQGQKIITGGEGGIIITNDREVYERGLLFGHYNKRCKQEILPDSKYYSYALTGFGLKLRAHPLAIAIAEEQMSHLPTWHDTMNANAKYLASLLDDVDGIKNPRFINEIEPSWYAFVIQVDPKKISISTQVFCDKLIENGISDADMPGSTCPLNLLKLFQEPSLLYPSYKGLVNYKPGDFPVAETFFNNAIKFPIDIYDTEDYKQVLENYATIIKRVLKDYSI
jgi:dTDP-4-amino-4,6-dideoxygalactose transaminase